MPTTLTNGIQLPDKGSVDWYSSMQSNYNLIDTHLGDTDVHVTAEDKTRWDSKQGSLSQDQLDAIAQVAINTDNIATLQSDKANASHTHSSSDITDIDDYATKDYVDNSISGLVDNAPDALNTLNELSAALNDDSNFASTVTTALGAKANSADLATVATSGSYTDLTDKPTIPTNTSDLTNDSDFVVSSNLATIATSGDYDDLSNKPSIPTNTSDLNNDSGFVTLNDFDIPAKTSDLTNDSGFITSSDVPTGTSDLINDSNFVDTSNPAVSSGITSAKVTDYDTHVADTDIHVTTADKTTWNTVTSKANDSDVVHKSGNETIGGKKTFSDDLTLYNYDSSQSTKNLNIASSKIQVGDTSNSDAFGIRFNAGASYVAQILAVNDTTGTQNLQLSIRTKDGSDNYITSMVRSRVATNGNSSFEPGANDSISLGSSSNRWKNVYATNYYYGSNNVEFSTKFVTTDTNQTISGNKTFEGVDLKLKSITGEYTVSSGSTSLLFYDKNSLLLSQYKLGVYGGGIPYQNFNIVGYDSNNQRVNKSITFSSSYLDLSTAYFRPDTDSDIFLGTTSNRWKEIHALNYYYGSNNVEFSTKFVTTDTAQTVSGSKTFSSNVNVYNSDSTTDTANIILKNSKAERGVESPEQSINFIDKNNNLLAKISCNIDNNNSTRLYITAYDINNNPDGFFLRKTTSGTSIIPTTSSAVWLGNIPTPFYSVQTKKINTLEPSSLSLPSDISARIDISSYFTNTGTGQSNNYTVPANGYIYLTLSELTNVHCFSRTSGNVTNYAQTFTKINNSTGALYVLFPVRKNDVFVTTWYTSTTVSVDGAYFIPCQGNV